MSFNLNPKKAFEERICGGGEKNSFLVIVQPFCHETSGNIHVHRRGAEFAAV